ncbi:3-isopropylmalate dehydratase small subunit [Salimicrobium humidisoli]|uniref:Uncharacterized protein n=1 Tax=Salimicrobium humidisoli TaxID=2029857 RepID=A0ABX4HRN1_9BACI|nr:hypothetical protein [Salimicrobium humidisoli]PBB05733.1 hypothetical protein CKW00_06960 [Salimicrobium humidisoli]
MTRQSKKKQLTLTYSESEGHSLRKPFRTIGATHNGNRLLQHMNGRNPAAIVEEATEVIVMGAIHAGEEPFQLTVKLPVKLRMTDEQEAQLKTRLTTEPMIESVQFT